jgi:hypothetical protein
MNLLGQSSSDRGRLQGAGASLVAPATLFQGRAYLPIICFMLAMKSSTFD